MRKITLMAIILPFLQGCGTMKFDKENATDRDLKKDWNDCLVKAGQAGFRGGDIFANMRRKDFMQQCMEGGGWTRTE